MLLRRGAAIIQDMAVLVAESVAESYLAKAGLTREGKSITNVRLQEDLDSVNLKATAGPKE